MNHPSRETVFPTGGEGQRKLVAGCPYPPDRAPNGAPERVTDRDLATRREGALANFRYIGSFCRPTTGSRTEGRNAGRLLRGFSRPFRGIVGEVDEMRNRYRGTVAALGAISALAVLVACGTDEPAQAPVAPTAVPTPIERILALGPDVPDSRSALTVNDLAGLRTATGIGLPASDGSLGAISTYVMDLVVGSNQKGGRQIHDGRQWLSGFHPYSDQVTTFPYLGFDARNAEQVALFGTELRVREVLLGSYDPEVTAQRLAACAECEQPETAEYSGTGYLSWGQDLAQNMRARLEPPAFDHLGRGGRIWVADGSAVRTLVTAHMEEIIDAALDRAPSLFDDPDYRLAARTLADRGGVTATFSSAGHSFDAVYEQVSRVLASDAFPVTPEELADQLSMAPLLLPFEVAAVGTSLAPGESGRTTTVLVLVHELEEEAEDGARRLRERIENVDVPFSQVETGKGGPVIGDAHPWAEEFDDFEVSTEGRAVVASFQAGRSFELRLLSLPDSIQSMSPLVITE